MKKFIIFILTISLLFTTSCNNKTEYSIEKENLAPKTENIVVEPAITSDTNNVGVEEKVIAAPKEKPDDETVTSEATTCNLIVTCSSVFDEENKIKTEDFGFLPENGIIYSKYDLIFQDGETVFDILKKELEANEIEFDYAKLPFYDPVYIKGIANLYEFDCGPNSGWLYKVNGTKPNFPCSEYVVKSNDNIEIIYTCNYLKDK